MHKVLTYVEYRAVSGVFQNIDPRGQFFEDARHWIGLLQYNPSTVLCLYVPMKSDLQIQYNSFFLSVSLFFIVSLLNFCFCCFSRFTFLTIWRFSLSSYSFSYFCSFFSLSFENDLSQLFSPSFFLLLFLQGDAPLPGRLPKANAFQATIQSIFCNPALVSSQFCCS